MPVRNKDATKADFLGLTPSRIYGRLVAATDTGHVIRWEALRAALATAPAATDDERVHWLASLANGENLRTKQLNALVGVVLASGNEDEPIEIGLNSESVDVLARLVNGKRVMKDKKKDKIVVSGDEDLLAAMRGGLLGNVLESRDGNGVRIVCRDASASFAYAMTLAARHPTLARCHWKACMRFFFQHGGGRPRRYCSDECTRDADDRRRRPIK